ncbi:MAG: hypothetical protein AB1705_18770, partial [Verrucomicrobiota bacterium]
ITVKKLFFTKRFNVADNCQFAVGEKDSAKLADLRKGQWANIDYVKAGGVLIARKVVQPDESVTGYIQAVDLEQRVLTIEEGGRNKMFKLAEDCKTIQHGDKQVGVEELRVGQRVRVVYANAGGSLVTHRIEQNQTTFSGTITAIDLSTRTVKAKRLLSNKQFALAKDCKIVGDGKPLTNLAQLRIGQPVSISFEEVQGVNVAYRVTQETPGSERDRGAESVRADKP